MKLLMLLSSLLWALALGEQAEVDDFQLREPLTEQEFQKEMQSGLHIVEFFSPYCPHCLEFAPHWEKAWKKFHPQGEKLNMSFVQVNCVKDGDLCAAEQILAYPAIRLYGPQGFIKNYPDDFAKTEEDLIRFARQEAMDPINMEAVDIKISSELLTSQRFNELVAGKGAEPYLVSFWPTKGSDNPLDDKMYDFCEDCQSFQKTWPLLSRKMLSLGVSTGHINCETSPNICKGLGFGRLVHPDYEEGLYPRVALVLPGTGVNNLFIYENGFTSSVPPYEDFVSRTIFNSEAPEISLEEIVALVHKDFKFPEEVDTPPPAQNLHVVFSYDPENVVPEDLHVLEHLVYPLSKIPNAYLHKSSDGVPVAAKATLNYMYEKINYNRSESEKLPKTEFLELNLFPQSPTFYIFKEGDWVPHLYRGDSATETRDVEGLGEWFNQSILPVITEVTANNFEQLLNFERLTTDAIVIQLVDLKDIQSIQESNENLNNFLIAAYDYEDVRMQNVVKVRTGERTAKNKKVKLLKAQKASSNAIGKAYHQEIAFLDYDKVILGYIDISKNNDLLKELGFTGGRDAYKSGDVLVVDPLEGVFYDKDVLGNELNTNSIYALRETLVKIVLPQLSRFHEKLESQKLKYIPKGGFSIFDPLIEYRVWRYFCVVGLIVLVCKVPSFYRKFKIGKNYKAKRNTTGLLGQTSKRSKD
ncbi:related to ER-retained PMA1-suppressing protein 1 [Zygosaccharomyces bailii]|nr:related to ER-retained PMA1-suppressing protein 1 [Zygosaccharomyces bailii]